MRPGGRGGAWGSECLTLKPCIEVSQQGVRRPGLTPHSPAFCYPKTLVFQLQAQSHTSPPRWVLAASNLLFSLLHHVSRKGVQWGQTSGECLSSQAPWAPCTLMAPSQEAVNADLKSCTPERARFTGWVLPLPQAVWRCWDPTPPLSPLLCRCAPVCVYTDGTDAALHAEALSVATRARQATPQSFSMVSPCQRGLGGIEAPHSPVLSALEIRSVALHIWLSSGVKSKVFLEFPGNGRVKWQKSWVFQKSCPDTCTSVQLIHIGFDPTYSRGGFFLSKWACWVAGGELMSPP